MTPAEAATWILAQVERDTCVYQEDVVDHLVRSNAEDLLRENADGNLVVGTPTLTAFRKITESTVVWVKSERYWRLRVPEDEPGREARG